MPESSLHTDLEEVVQSLLVFLVQHRENLQAGLDAVDRLFSRLATQCTHKDAIGRTAIGEQLYGVDRVPLRICRVCGRSWSV